MKDNEPDRIQDTAVQYGKLYRLEKENKDKRRICLIAERLSAIMWQILPPDCSVNKRLWIDSTSEVDRYRLSEGRR